MKKLILLLTLTMMFGQTDVTSKIISYDITVNDDHLYVPISEIINFDVNRGSIQYIGMEGELTQWALNIYYYASNSSIGLTTYTSYSEISPTHQGITSGANTYFFDTSLDYMSFKLTSGSQPFDGTLHFLVTAEFPIEDTGYIEDGFDYCVEPGANLMSYPCDSSVALLDAIPADALSQFSGIIGQGLASVQLPNGKCVGSLSNMQASSGYWITSTTSLCFNYDCSEN